MKKIIYSLAFIFSISSFSQVTNEGVPNSWSFGVDNSDINEIELPSFDLDKVKAEDKVNDNEPSVPWRFGYMHSVDYGLEDGSWTTLENGDRIWRILISSPGALSLNFIFDDFYMPDGGYIYIYNDDRTDLLGAYDSQQNQESGILGTWLVEGDKVWIEYYEPNEFYNQGRLHIAKATHGYRNAKTFNEAKALNQSGHCNLDVECSIGDDWVDLKDHHKRASALLISGGSSFCSGALINNTENDGTPYFLTADHCTGSSAAAWSFRFGWISPTTVCATTQSNANGPTNMTISGATIRARSSASDFALVEINNNIPASWDRVFSGWDNSGQTPDFTVGIHHPVGDVMKVCRDDDQPIQAFNFGYETWEITTAGGGWEFGVTEGGSSGSPLYDHEGRIIGQLYGGAAACSGLNDNNQFDYYGRIDVSWNGGGTSSSRLKDWLDPNDTGATDVGPYPALTLLAYDMGIDGVDSPITGTLTDNESITVSITNYGSEVASNFDVSYQINGGTVVTETYTESVDSEQTVQYTFSTTADLSTVGAIYTIVASVSLPGDDNPENDSISVEVEHLNPNDIGVSEIISPSSGTNLSNAEQVTVTITNYGGATQSNFNVSFELDGELTTETVEGPLVGNSTLEYTFTQTIDISTIGVYSLTVYTSLGNDSDMSNDSSTISITHLSCQPTATIGCTVDGIKKFILGDIDIDDGANGCNGVDGYADRTNLSTDLDRADGNNVHLLQAQHNWSNATGEALSVWIDFNDNGVFEDSERLISGETFSVSGQLDDFVLTIPVDAALGSHTLRAKAIDITVSGGTTNILDPCADYSYGEVHDYTVNIGENLSTDNFEINYAELIVHSNDNEYFSINLMTNYSEVLELSVYDLRGRMLSFDNIFKSNNLYYNHNLDMSRADSGIYIIKLGNQTVGYKTVKIVVR